MKRSNTLGSDRRSWRQLAGLASAVVFMAATACSEASGPPPAGNAIPFAALEQAAHNAAACMREQGLQSVESEYSTLAFTHGFSVRGDSPTVDQIVTACRLEHYEQTSVAWQKDQLPAIKAHNERYRTLVLDCLREAGWAVGTTEDQLAIVDSEFADDRLQCVMRATDLLR